MLGSTRTRGLIYTLLAWAALPASAPAASERAIWAGVAGHDWKPPQELRKDVTALLTKLSSTAVRKFQDVRDNPLPNTRITLRVSFDPEKRKLRILRVENATSREVFETVQASVKEGLEGAHFAPEFQPWLAKMETISFIFYGQQSGALRVGGYKGGPERSGRSGTSETAV